MRLIKGLKIGLTVGISIAGIFCNKGPEMQEMTWHPVQGKIMTTWAEDVTPATAHAEYPRPQMKRKEWLNLNGMWEYAIRPVEEKDPENYDGSILVPFPVESALSGVKKPVGKENRLWYRRTFTIPEKWSKKRIFLNFEAVDWETTVWINGHQIGSHRGGYDPFGFDISDAVKKSGKQEVVLSVWDPINEGTQPTGKQVRNPHSIWYTSVTGIWGTAWLEPVEKTHIASLKIIPDIDAEKVHVIAYCSDEAPDCRIELAISGEEQPPIETSGMADQKISVVLKDARLWSPDSPFLYDLEVLLRDEQGSELDRVESYFGMRKISIEKDKNGVNRLFLNNRDQFMMGPLDQGWWPDGLYTAPTDEALRYDLEVTKRLGMNMLRKHVKVEPRRFYYWCDKLGILVWQDMPNGDAHIDREGQDIQRSPESSRQFQAELQRMIAGLFNHPCIVMWIPFNEGWGQYDTVRLVEWIGQLDPTRLINNASGWADRGVGDVRDIHAYPGPDAPANEPNRAAVLGEFGGLGLPAKEHTWQEEKNWGYRSFKTADELTQAYLDLIKKLKLLAEGGLSAAVYTQTTDVEIEVNGLMTYDRAIIKMDAERVAEVNEELTKR